MNRAIETTNKKTAIITSGPDFLDKYILRRLADEGYAVTSGRCPDLAIHIAGTTDPEEALKVEATATVVIIPRGVIIDTDAMRTRNPRLTVLRLPYVVGTGMTGLLIEMAAMISRGTMFHIKDNEAATSVVHAIDVARLAVSLADTSGDYTVTDLTHPTWHELAEALSARTGHKRILTLSSKLAQWAAKIGPLIGGPDTAMLRTITSDFILTPNLPAEAAENMITVTEYLSNHQYDENDL